MPPEESSPLDSLQKKIYQVQPQGTVEVPAYSNESLATPYGWQTPPEPLPEVKKPLSWATRFLIGAGVFCVIAAGVAAFLIFQGTRAISSDRVTIEMQPIVSVASGDTVSIAITIHNGNPAPLNNATFFATLPPGTRSGDGSEQPLEQYSTVIGTIPAGADVTESIPVKLFGTEGQSLDIPMRLEYHVTGSNALLVTQKDFSVTVSSSPISVQVQTLSESPSGQPFTIMVTVRSNANAPVDNVAVLAQYPAGFSARTSEPAPTNATFFTLGKLVPGDQRVIKITGVLIGQNGDHPVFRFTAGSVNPDGTSTLGSSFAEGDATVAITHPFLNVGLSLNREVADSVLAEPGTSIGAVLTWQNMLTTTLSNASIRVALSGNALNVASIKGGTGFYRSQDTSVVFDSTSNAPLASLAAGDKGIGSFTFDVKSPDQLVGVRNPTIQLAVSITGQQGSQGTTPQTLTTTLTRTVKITSVVTVKSTISPVSGPTPPAAGTPTIYDVALTAKNTVNSVGAAKETFQLPSYVTFIDSKAGAGVTYNPDTRTVTWLIGDIAPSGTALVHFQLSFAPSTSQIGTKPLLIQDQSFSGVDRFTQQQVFASSDALTTELPGQPLSGTVH